MTQNFEMQFSGYTLQDLLSETHNSIVYRARRDGHSVIIKVIRLKESSPALIARLRHEYQLIRGLDIDGIIKALDFMVSDGQPALVLEDFGGVALKQLLTGPLGLERFLELAIRLADILGRLHQNNVSHRDINPHNILINAHTGVLKISDFGISAHIARLSEEISSDSALEGTLAYISPEQTGRMNCAEDYRTDFYSLGVTFYEMLTGTVPFLAKDPLEIIHAHIARLPEPPAQRNAEVPPALSAIVMKLLAKSAAERYQNGFGLAADLRRCQEQLRTTGGIAPFDLGRQDISLRFIIPQGVVGRAAELEQLHAAFERAGQGAVELVLVTGEPGIGKSALVNELHKPIVARRGYFIAGKFDQSHGAVPYSAIIQAFQGLVRQLLAENDANLRRWKQKLLAALGPNGKIITDAIAEIELIIGPQPRIPELGPKESRNRFNLVFINFVRAFAEPSHPLVLFLDDLQWADSASIQLIETIATDSGLNHLLIIGAYRDRETAAHHPFMLTRDAIAAAGLPVHTIHLGALDANEINQLIASFLHCAAEVSLPLAQAIHAKTKGSPFFVNQFLKTLYDQHHLVLDPAKGWHWDIDQIRQLQVTDNVVRFMADRLQLLADRPLELIRICACIGNRFDLETLALITGQNQQEVLSVIDDLIQDGLINQQGELYRFHHDRIQEAAHLLLAPDERRQLHYRIGQLDLKRTPETQLFNLIFYICDQLNQAGELIATQAERTELAQLNLKAGLKAKESSAYAAAVSYLTHGTALLAADAWQNDYELAYALHLQQMECRYLNRDFDEAERLFKIVIAKACTKVDKARAYNVMIVLYTNLRSPKEAINLGIEALRIFGIKVSMDIGKGPVAVELIKAHRALKRIGLEKILDLPLIHDQESLVIYELMLNTGFPAYYVNQNLYAWLTLKGVNRGFKQGMAPQASMGLNVLANIIQSVLGDYDLALRIGQTALKLDERLDNRKKAGMVLYTFAYFIQHWNRHLRHDLELYPKAYELALNAGDFIIAGISITAASADRLTLGHRLAEILEELEKYKDFMVLLNDPSVLDLYRMRTQWVLALQGCTALRHDISGNGFDLGESIERIRREEHFVGLCFMLNASVQFNVLYARYEEALQAAVEMDQHIKKPMGTMLVADHCHTYSLILIALLRSGKGRRGYMAKIRRNQRKMRKWAQACPENFKHRYDLVAAELAALGGRFRDALQLYRAAIDGAHENAFISVETMACERLAEVYLSENHRPEAGLFIRRAHQRYLDWGATAKADDLRERYPDLLASEQPHGTAGTHTRTASSESTTHTLDLSTVMQVSQVISSEIKLEGLLEKTMHMSIANAGAQRGYLIMESDGRLAVQASEDVNTGQKTVLQALALEGCDGLSPAIVNYVLHSGEHLILGHAAKKGAFINDPHVLAHACKSILCMSIMNKGRLACILYLENNLTADTFTPERLEILRVISAQAAISLQNAKLYEEISTEIAVRKQAEEAMRASEGKYRTILEEMQDVYCEIDLNGVVTFINPATSALSGFEVSELIGSRVRDHWIVDESETIESYFREIFATGRPGKPLNINLRAKDATIKNMEIVAAPLRNQLGAIVGFRTVGRDVGERKRLEHDLLESYKNVQTARAATILGLAKLAEYRDEDTGTHLERIREYARILALELGTKPQYRDYITPEYIEDIYNSAILHDIGKVGVPDAILLKPGKLTREEFEIIKTHASLGGDALQAVETNIEGQTFLTLGKEIAYYHHEKWDGSGYNAGLKGEEIPLSARIVALADVYDALTSKRTYKEAFSHQKAVEIILGDRGTHFDPDVVDAFMAHAEAFRRIREETLGE